MYNGVSPRKRSHTRRSILTVILFRLRHIHIWIANVYMKKKKGEENPRPPAEENDGVGSGRTHSPFRGARPRWTSSSGRETSRPSFCARGGPLALSTPTLTGSAPHGGMGRRRHGGPAGPNYGSRRRPRR